MTDTPKNASADLDIDVPPEELWDLLTGSEGFSSWMGGESKIEPWEGGKVIADDLTTGVPKSGQVVKVDEGRSISWEWSPISDSDADPTQVHIQVTPSQTGSLIEVTETAPARLSATSTISTNWQWSLAIAQVTALPPIELRVRELQIRA